VLFSARIANARDAEKCERTEAWVDLEWEGAPDLEARVRQELAVELESHDVVLCTHAGGRPIAHLEAVLVSSAARLVVRDAITTKVVERTVDLSKIADDARPVGIALALDELLRASWAELLLQQGDRDAEIPPPTATKAPEHLAKKARASVEKTRARIETNARAAIVLVAESYLQGQPRFGADVRFSWMPLSWLGLGVRMGYRRATSAAAPDGSIDADVFLAGGEGELALTPPRSIRLWTFAGFDVARVLFRGVASSGAHSANEGATALDAMLGLRLRWALLRALEIAVSVGLGAPFVRAEALDRGRVAAGTTGALLTADFGAAAVF